MELPADERCAGAVVRALREAGHNVIAIAESARGASDESVIKLALEQRRVVVTEDRDFGELVYARTIDGGSVVLKVPGPGAKRQDDGGGRGRSQTRSTSARWLCGCRTGSSPHSAETTTRVKTPLSMQDRILAKSIF